MKKIFSCVAILMWTPLWASGSIAYNPFIVDNSDTDLQCWGETRNREPVILHSVTNSLNPENVGSISGVADIDLQIGDRQEHYQFPMGASFVNYDFGSGGRSHKIEGLPLVRLQHNDGSFQDPPPSMTLDYFLAKEDANGTLSIELQRNGEKLLLNCEQQMQPTDFVNPFKFNIFHFNSDNMTPYNMVYFERFGDPDQYGFRMRRYHDMSFRIDETAPVDSLISRLSLMGSEESSTLNYGYWLTLYNSLLFTLRFYDENLEFPGIERFFNALQNSNAIPLLGKIDLATAYFFGRRDTKINMDGFINFVINNYSFSRDHLDRVPEHIDILLLSLDRANIQDYQAIRQKLQDVSFWRASSGIRALRLLAIDKKMGLRITRDKLLSAGHLVAANIESLRSPLDISNMAFTLENLSACMRDPRVSFCGWSEDFGPHWFSDREWRTIFTPTIQGNPALRSEGVENFLRTVKEARRSRPAID